MNQSDSLMSMNLKLSYFIFGLDIFFFLFAKPIIFDADMLATQTMNPSNRIKANPTQLCVDYEFRQTLEKNPIKLILKHSC